MASTSKKKQFIALFEIGHVAAICFMIIFEGTVTNFAYLSKIDSGYEELFNKTDSVLKNLNLEVGAIKKSVGIPADTPIIPTSVIMIDIDILIILSAMMSEKALLDRLRGGKESIGSYLHAVHTVICNVLFSFSFLVSLSALLTQLILIIKGAVPENIYGIGILHFNFFFTFFCFRALSSVYIPQIGLLCQNNPKNAIILQEEFDEKKNIADLEIMENKANEKANENPPTYSEV